MCKDDTITKEYEVDKILKEKKYTDPIERLLHSLKNDPKLSMKLTREEFEANSIRLSNSDVDATVALETGYRLEKEVNKLFQS